MQKVDAAAPCWLRIGFTEASLSIGQRANKHPPAWGGDPFPARRSGFSRFSLTRRTDSLISAVAGGCVPAHLIVVAYGAGNPSDKPGRTPRAAPDAQCRVQPC